MQLGKGITCWTRWIVTGTGLAIFSQRSKKDVWPSPMTPPRINALRAVGEGGITLPSIASWSSFYILGEQNQRAKSLLLLPWRRQLSDYRRKRSCGKIMFLHLCVILFTGRGVLTSPSKHATQVTWPGGVWIQGGGSASRGSGSRGVGQIPQIHGILRPTSGRYAS